MPSRKPFITDLGRGSMLVEIMVASAILLIVFSGWLDFYYETDRMVARAQEREETYSQDDAAFEELHARSSVDFDSLISTSTLEIEDIDSLTKDVQFYGFYTRLFDWKHAQGTKTCVFDKNWSHARVSGSIDLGTSTTATGVFSEGKYVYITADSAVANKEDFFVIDASDIDHPSIISKINTGPGLIALSVSGDYAYVGNSSINAQLQVINIIDPYNPVLVSALKLPGVYSDSTTVSNSLYHSKNKLYLGTKKSTIAELHSIDVSNPYAPAEIGSWESNTAINALLAKGDALYVGSPDNEELKILSVRDAAHISRIGGYDAAGNSGSGNSLYSVGTTTYFGRTQGNPELYIFNTSSTTPGVLGSLKIGSTINSIVSDGKLAFLATSDQTKELQILSVVDPQHITTLANIDLPAKAVALDCGDNIVYVALDSEDGLRIISPQ